MNEERAIVTAISTSKGDVTLQDTQVEILPPDQRNLEDIAAAIRLAKAAAAQSILEIGNLLIEAKAQLTRHGQWRDWLANVVSIPERTAQRYMLLAREYSNPTLVSDLGMTKSLALLKLPAEDRDDFIKKYHEIGGKQKTIHEMSVREVRTEIRKKSDDYWIIKQRTDYTEIADELESAQKHLNAALKLLDKYKWDRNIRNYFLDSVCSINKTAQECQALIPPEFSTIVSVQH